MVGQVSSNFQHACTQLIIGYNLVSVLTVFIIMVSITWCAICISTCIEKREKVDHYHHSNFRSNPAWQVHVWLLHDGMDQKKIIRLPLTRKVAKSTQCPCRKQQRTTELAIQFNCSLENLLNFELSNIDRMAEWGSTALQTRWHHVCFCCRSFSSLVIFLSVALVWSFEIFRYTGSSNRSSIFIL